MARALITISFMAVLLWWLQNEFHKNVSLKKYWKWFAAAIVVQAIASIISLLISDRVVGNFFLPCNWRRSNNYTPVCLSAKNLRTIL
jgi:hypothetical protein